jgi:hypothetical protein
MAGGPHDSKLARVRVATEATGTFANVGLVRSASIDRGTEGETVLRWLGGEAVRPGELTLGGTVPVWWDNEDTTGQQILESAYLSGDTVFLQIAPKGTETGAEVKQFEAHITEAPLSFDSEGEAVEGSFSFRGLPETWETLTLS